MIYFHIIIFTLTTPLTLCVNRRLLSNPLSQGREIKGDVFDNTEKRERFLKRVLNHFWERWRKEYLRSYEHNTQFNR